MPIKGVPCFEKLMPNLLAEYKKRINESMSESELRNVGIKLALEEFERNHKDLQNLKKSLKLPLDKYESPDTSPKVKEITDDYNKQIEQKKKELTEQKTAEENKKTEEPQKKEPPPEPPKEEGKGTGEAKTALEQAKEVRRAAKAKLEAKRGRMGIISDPKQDAQDLFDYHKALVNEAKEYVKLGIKTVQDFAKEIGEKVSIAVRTAWDEATGKIEPITNGEKLNYDLLILRL